MTGSSDRSLRQSTSRDEPTLRRFVYQSPRRPDEVGGDST
jgi:hypothetical protein